MQKPLAASELILRPDGSVYHLGLLPHQLAHTIITVGDPERVSRVSQYFDSITHRSQQREFVVHTGTFKGKAISVVSTGIGTDNVEIVLTELDALVNIDFATRLPRKQLVSLDIVRLGTSGSLQPYLPVDTVLASRQAVGLDSLMHFYNWQESEDSLGLQLGRDLSLGFAPYTTYANADLLLKVAYDMPPGITLTCPGFYAPQGRVLRMQPKVERYFERLQAFRSTHNQAFTNFEMETAGLYAMATLLGHRALSLSAIVANRSAGTFASDPDEVINGMIKKVLPRL
jgi:uridine phosphorylase